MKCFVDVMYELERNMLLLGYRDYEKACNVIFEEFDRLLSDPPHELCRMKQSTALLSK